MKGRVLKTGRKGFARINEQPNDDARVQGSGSARSVSQITGRPRSPATQKRIMVAVLSMLKSQDYKDISIERLAAKARVSKHSIYRWWHSKGDLILDAVLDYALQQAAQPRYSNDIFADLEQFVMCVYQAWHDPLYMKGLRGLAIEISFDPSLRQRFSDAYVAPRKQILASLLKSGVVAGQLRADTDIDAVVDVLLGYVWFHLSFELLDDFDERRAAQKLAMILRQLLEIRT